MGEVSRDDLQGAIFAEDFDYNEFVALMTKHIEIQIPDHFAALVKTEQADGSKQPFTEADNVLRNKLLDHVYDAIIELNKKEEPIPAVDPVPTSIGNPGGTKETVTMEPPEEKEPEIKIDLNLGSDESASSDEATARVEEPEVEEHIGAEVPTKGDPPVSQEESPLDVSAPVTPDSAPSSSTEVEQSEHDKQRHPSITSTSGTPAYADRKSHIIALVRENKWTLKQITQIIDDQWGYAAKGKSSKTRVSKTIRDLKDNQMLYEESNGILTWKGEG